MVKEAPLIAELYVRDFEQSVSFYTEILGFHILYDRLNEKFAMLEREGAQIMIEQLGVTRNWLAGELVQPFGRGVNFQILVSDIQTLHKNICKHGFPFFLDMEDKWYQTDIGFCGNRQFIVQDPNGYLLRFYQDLGVKKNL